MATLNSEGRATPRTTRTAERVGHVESTHPGRHRAYAAALLCVGVLIRALYAFPVHKYVPDADSTLSAIQAMDILNGTDQVFYTGFRLGSLESYLIAIAFQIFGVSRLAISLTALFSGILALFAFFFFFRELFGERLVLFALVFFALPSPAYMAWSYMPNGYPEILLLCLLILAFAARLARRGFEYRPSLALGLSSGIGFWTSPQTLMCTVPAVTWLLVMRRRDLRKNMSLLALLVGGFLAGASPWIIYNAGHGFPSLRQDFGMKSVAGVDLMAANAEYLVGYGGTELTVGADPFHLRPRTEELNLALRAPTAAAYGLGLLALFFLPASRRLHSASPRDRPPFHAFVLLWMIAMTVMLLYVTSAAGEQRGYTVRYLLPLFFVLAGGLGILANEIGRRSRILSVILVSIVVSFNVSGYSLPWSSERRYLREQLKNDEGLVAFLENQGLQWVCGNYWVVYPFTFESRGRISGVPVPAILDRYRVDSRVFRGSRWGLVARNVNWLVHWVHRSKLQGQILSVGPDYRVFLPSKVDETRLTAPEALAHLRLTAPEGGQ